GLALALGGTGVAIVGTLAVLAGSLLVTGASAGALIRRTATAARRSLDRALPEPIEQSPELISTASVLPLVDGTSAFPDVVGSVEPAPVIPFPEQDTQESVEQPSLFDAKPLEAEYKLPDRNVLRRSGTNGATPSESNGQVAHALVQALADFGVHASVVGEITGPRVTRYELQLAA